MPDRLLSELLNMFIYWFIHDFEGNLENVFPHFLHYFHNHGEQLPATVHQVQKIPIPHYMFS